MSGVSPISEAAILVGGLGTRLRTVLADKPKALALVAGKPILGHILDALARMGVKKGVLCTGYLGDQVQDAFGSSYEGMSLVYSREEAPLGTAGALARAADSFQADRLLVLNGDSFTPFSAQTLAESHEARQAVATILLARVDDASRYGAVDIDDEGAVIQWNEKGESSSVGPACINAGVYLMNTQLVGSLQRSNVNSLEKELFPSLIGKGLFAIRNSGPFIDIGTPESLAKADAFFRSFGNQ